jgi:uncharacterized paraquat-inducible protein A
MTNMQKADQGLAAGELVHILWRCNECDSFISTHSLETVQMAVCPVCLESPLDYCGTFENITRLHEEDPVGGFQH